MDNVFRKEYKPLDQIAITHMNDIKDKAQELWDLLELANFANPRMIALAKTNLEQAVMWSTKAITA